MKKRLVIVGLGLIGGSMALALRGFEDFEIVGVDVSQPTLRFAAEHGVADFVTDDASSILPEADVVVLALHPRGITDFLARHKDHFQPGCLVTDVCGVKTAVLEAAEVLPETVDFIGCHPMAGTEFSGVEHAFPQMFQGAHFLMVPRPDSRQEHIALLERMSMAALAAGADGLIIEVHNDPPHALCDGAQSITPAQFEDLMGKLRTLAPCVGREL